MRNTTFVNRRNMHKSGRPGFAEMHEYYWGPMQEFRSANVDLLASQELELQDLGLEVPGQSPLLRLWRLGLRLELKERPQ